MWVQVFRNSDKQLGAIIKDVFEKRGAHWDYMMPSHIPNGNGSGFPPTHPGLPPPAVPPRLTNKEKKQFKKAAAAARKATKGKGKGKGDKAKRPRLTPGTLASSIPNGPALCPDFNAGKCASVGPACPKGAHKCSMVTKGGRVCGLTNHGAHNCRNK